MNTFRHIIALLLVTIVPAVLLYWLLLHSLLPVWRKLGVTASQYLLWAPVIAVAFFLTVWREPPLRGEYGFQPMLAVVGAVFLVGAIVARLQIERFLPWRTQLGLPEIDPFRYEQKLVTNGPYAHTRHPRYIQVTLALAGWALVANYPAGYFTALLWIPFMLLIVHLEEAELQRRFGLDYGIYCQRTARFWPHPVAVNRRVKV